MIRQKLLSQKPDKSPTNPTGQEHPQTISLSMGEYGDQPHRRLLPLSLQWLSIGVSFLDLLLLFLLVIFLTGLGSYPVVMRGVTPLLNLLFVLALVSALLTIGMIIGGIMAWMRKFWTSRSRIHYTLITLAAILFVLELLYWNMLGFRV
jgi:amino acid transporter